MKTCAPTGNLAPIVLLDGACRCGAKLHAVPAGDEWGYADEDGRTCVNTAPQAYRDDPKGWWDTLAATNIALYASLSARVNLGMFAWSHTHHRILNSGVGGPYDVPECHEMPMQYVPSGWRCRVENVVFSFVEEQAVA